MSTVTISRLDGDGALAAVPALAEVLKDCVDGGASVGFVWPFELPEAEAFWRGVAAKVRSGTTALLIAEDASGIAGTVQVQLAMMPNQPHRGEVSKLLVHRRARRRGIAQALMLEAQTLAAAAGKTILVLDTATPEAERIYERLGWVASGAIPDYALFPDGSLCATTFYYRRLP